MDRDGFPTPPEARVRGSGTMDLPPTHVEYHLVPADDTFFHQRVPECLCSPEIEKLEADTHQVEPDSFIIKHRAMDGVNP